MLSAIFAVILAAFYPARCVGQSILNQLFERACSAFSMGIAQNMRLLAVILLVSGLIIGFGMHNYHSDEIDVAGSVGGVQKERGIDSRLESFTRDEMIFRVGWWLKCNDDYYTLRKHVNRAIVNTFKAANVVFPYQKGRFDLESDEDHHNDPGT